MTFRGFVAADFPGSPRLSEFAKELETSGASLKVVDVGQIHATLKFLGETEDGLVLDIVERMRTACKGIPSFPVTLRSAGAFPSVSRMNVIWIGISGADPLATIAARLDASFASLGFPPERRPWAPHVTIARVKGGRNLDRVRQILVARKDDTFADAVVDRVRLKKSVLTPSGPTYSTVEDVLL
ncbi:MAG TPA: RNA 2',3'-cyclic phosphodiesterase [Thermoplasmata archaeon]|nr:RNA 2',3'-cyclic phosphodiesterase [Thermoplasmata archaeon]